MDNLLLLLLLPPLLLPLLLLLLLHLLRSPAIIISGIHHSGWDFRLCDRF